MPILKTLRAYLAQDPNVQSGIGRAARQFFLVLIALIFSLSCQTAKASFPQTVFLDFDAFTDTGADPTDFIYTVPDRMFITDVLNDKFIEFPVTFTDTVPTTGLYSTVFFNAGLGSASGIDFQNKKMSDTATLHAPKLLDVAGIPLGSATPLEVLAASVNVGAHETLHLLGTRHHDAFLPIGTGVSFGEGGGDWAPAYTGPEGAFLTSMEFNGLTTSFGPIPASLLTSPDLFVGPRSAVKLLHDTFIDVDTDSDDKNSAFDPQPLTRKTYPIPNNLPLADPLFGFDLFVDVVIVEEASIEIIDKDPITGLSIPPGPESDYYSITGEEGDLFFIEVISEAVDESDSVDSVVALLDPLAGFSPVPGYSFNDDERETTDSLIFDVTLPYSGTFVIEVFSTGKDGNDLGDYEMLVYSFHAVPEPSSICLALLSFTVMFGFVYRRRNQGARTN